MSKLKKGDKYTHKQDGYEVKIVRQVANMVTFKDEDGNKHKLKIEQFNQEFDKSFEPIFDGYLQLYMGGDESKLIERLKTTGDWQTKQKKIINKDRKFQVELYIYDTDGDKRGEKTVTFSECGNDRDLASVIKEHGDLFIKEIKSDKTSKYLGFIPDLENCVVRIRA